MSRVILGDVIDRKTALAAALPVVVMCDGGDGKVSPVSGVW